MEDWSLETSKEPWHELGFSAPWMVIGGLLGCWQKQMPPPVNFSLSVSEQKQGLSLWVPLLAASSVMLLPNKSWGGCFWLYNFLSLLIFPSNPLHSQPDEVCTSWVHFVWWLPSSSSAFFFFPYSINQLRGYVGERLSCPSEYLTVGSGEGHRPPSVLPSISVCGSNAVCSALFFFFFLLLLSSFSYMYPTAIFCLPFLNTTKLGFTWAMLDT